jgi:hypothetical protein
MGLPVAFRQQHGYRPANQFRRRVAKERLAQGIDEEDLLAGIADDGDLDTGDWD